MVLAMCDVHFLFHFRMQGRVQGGDVDGRLARPLLEVIKKKSM